MILLLCPWLRNSPASPGNRLKSSPSFPHIPEYPICMQYSIRFFFLEAATGHLNLAIFNTLPYKSRVSLEKHEGLESIGEETIQFAAVEAESKSTNLLAGIQIL